MNVTLPRLLRAIYRKEPISSFVFIVGAVDVAIGGVDQSWSLLTFGLGAVGVAVALRWSHSQRQPQEEPEKIAVHALPPASNRNRLPTLSAAKKRPPNL